MRAFIRAIWLYLRCLHANLYASLAAATTALSLAYVYPAIMSGHKELLVFTVMMAAIGFIVFIALGAANDTYTAYKRTVADLQKQAGRTGYTIPKPIRYQVRVGIELACKDNMTRVWYALHA